MKIFFGHLNRLLEIDLCSLSASIAMPREKRKRKPRKQPIEGNTQSHNRVAHASKETPKSSARAIEQTKRESLTLFDWMAVYAYVNTLPQLINQGK